MRVFCVSTYFLEGRWRYSLSDFRGLELTFELRSNTVQLPQGDKLFLNLAVLVNQYRWCILLGIPLDAHIGPDLAELNIAELRRQLSPEIVQHSGLDIAPQRRGEVDEHECLGRRLRDLVGVVCLLDGIDLVVYARLLQPGEFGYSLFSGRFIC